MRQKLLLTMLLLLSIVAPFAALADSFTIKPVELELGQSATLQFNLENTQAYYGFQADVTLPDGIEVKKVSLSDRAAGEAMFKLNSKTVSNGSLRIAAFSSNHNAFTENDGVLVNMEVTVANTYEGGDIEVSNIIFTDKDNQDVKLDPTSLTPDVKLTGLSFRRSDVSLNLDENETTTLVPIYTPEIATNKTVSWESSDESVATVSEKGEVTPLKVGTTDITATSSNGLIAKITVTVTTDVVSVTAISVSPTSLELTEGDTEKLTATITPTDATDKSVTWHSSNESIATVDENGNVDAIKVGTTTITVESSNGKTASCTVTVNAKIYLAESVTLNKETSELKVGETVKLTASVLPENTTNKTVTWTTSDATIATVEDGVVTAVAIGEATSSAV